MVPALFLGSWPLFLYYIGWKICQRDWFLTDFDMKCWKSNVDLWIGNCAVNSDMAGLSTRRLLRRDMLFIKSEWLQFWIKKAVLGRRLVAIIWLCVSVILHTVVFAKVYKFLVLINLFVLSGCVSQNRWSTQATKWSSQEYLAI